MGCSSNVCEYCVNVFFGHLFWGLGMLRGWDGIGKGKQEKSSASRSYFGSGCWYQHGSAD